MLGTARHHIARRCTASLCAARRGAACYARHSTARSESKNSCSDDDNDEAGGRGSRSRSGAGAKGSEGSDDEEAKSRGSSSSRSSSGGHAPVVFHRPSSRRSAGSGSGEGAMQEMYALHKEPSQVAKSRRMRLKV